MLSVMETDAQLGKWKRRPGISAHYSLGVPSEASPGEGFLDQASSCASFHLLPSWPVPNPYCLVHLFAGLLSCMSSYTVMP